MDAYASPHDEIRIMPVLSEIHTRKLSCQAAESTVKRRGAVLAHFGEAAPERVVAFESLCLEGAEAVPFYAPTLDSDACFLGYRCLGGTGEGGKDKHY